jgi:hypothetical protein
MDADPKVARLRTFLTGVWQLFEHSQNPAQAREALNALEHQVPAARRTDSLALRERLGWFVAVQHDKITCEASHRIRR